MRRGGFSARLAGGLLSAVAAALLSGCRPSATPRAVDAEASARDRMVATQIVSRGIRDPRLLSALRAVPRHVFVDPAYRADAYADRPVPIGEGQTMTQPYVAALMTELLDIQPSDRILEIGTGSGYESAVLSRLAAEVYSIEILPDISRRAQGRLRTLGCANVRFRIGDGYGGWPDAAPFDGILVTAAPRRIPPALLEQLAPDGRMVIPVGDFFQELRVYAKDAKGSVTESSVIPVRFGTMQGEAQKPPP
jgi:protein-L-isoaspartate(D-aspartate) O-methyltransferase